MKLYANAYLVFGVRVSCDLREFLEEGDAIRKFNKKNFSGLGSLAVGWFDDQELYLVTYFENSEPLEHNRPGLKSLTRRNKTAWKRQIEKFLREQEIAPEGEIGIWLLAGLDN